MNYRASEDHLAASEEFSPNFPSGSVLFSQPAEVDSWCQSIGFPPTPPDTASECSFPDYPEMSGPSWKPSLLPEESTATARDPATIMESAGDVWHGHGQPVTAQDLQALDVALDSASWLDVPQGSVELGLSPVLSQESQSTYTLNSLSESEIPLLPSGLDLSFISEPSWDVSGPVVYSSSYVPQEFPTAMVVSPQEFPTGFLSGSFAQGYNTAQPLACGLQQPMVYLPSSLPPRRSVPDALIPQPRPLLPRINGKSVTSSANGQLKDHSLVTQHYSRSTGCPDTAIRVSNAQPPLDKVRSSGPVSIQRTGPATQHVRTSPRCVAPNLRPENAPRTMTLVSTLPPDHIGEGSATITGYGQEGEPYIVNASYSLGCEFMPSSPPAMGDKDFAPEPDSERGNARHVGSSGSIKTSVEGDEGRHRNHPLYSKGPQADGLYHCPFKSDPNSNCQHKPTKLKCNYDKFVDSHVKPFRCKVEACSKQEFSSTACLLRHEREAHGMHGHGDRPHLCYYPHCERGNPGNGFPRRYNLFDHMKRVHDHKDDPSMGSDAGTRNPTGRKRKSHGLSDEERPAQRQRMQNVSQAPTTLSMHSEGFAPQGSAYPEFLPSSNPVQQDVDRHQALYSQWTNQRELLDFQLQTVRNSDDEANLQRLSQDVEQSRRLSQQARHG